MNEANESVAVFQYSKLYRRTFFAFGLLSLAVAIAIAVICAAIHPPEVLAEWIVAATLSVGFVLSGAFLIRLARQLNHCIVIDANSISQVWPNQSVRTIPWNDISEIRRRRFHQRTDVCSNRLGLEIRIHHQIDDFFELMNHVNRRDIAARAPMSIFHRSLAAGTMFFVVGILIAGGAVFLMMSSPNSIRSFESWGGLLIGTLGVCQGIAMPRALSIQRDGIEIRYPLRTKQINFQDISSLGMRQVHGKYNSRFNMIVITQTNGKELMLSSFIEGDDFVFDCLKSAFAKFKGIEAR